MKNSDVGCLGCILILILDFFFTAFCYWLITLVLGACGLAIPFTWGFAFAFWVVCKILKLIF